MDRHDFMPSLYCRNISPPKGPLLHEWGCDPRDKRSQQNKNINQNMKYISKWPQLKCSVTNFPKIITTIIFEKYYYLDKNNSLTAVFAGAAV